MDAEAQKKLQEFLNKMQGDPKVDNEPKQEQKVEMVEVGGKQVPKDIYEIVKRHVSDEVNRGQKDNWKKELLKEFAEIENLKQASTYKEALAFLKQQVETQKPENPINAEKLEAQIRAKIESEYNEKLTGERRQLAEQAFFSQLNAVATAKGLNQKYNGKAALLLGLRTEFDDKGELVFRDSSGAILLNGKDNPTPEFFANKLFEANQELFTVPKIGTGQVTSQAGLHGVDVSNMSASDIIQQSIKS